MGGLITRYGRGQDTTRGRLLNPGVARSSESSNESVDHAGRNTLSREGAILDRTADEIDRDTEIGYLGEQFVSLRDGRIVVC